MRGVLAAAVLAPALASLLALAACQPGGGSDAAFGARVKAYLSAHPEVVGDAIQKLQAREQAEEDVAQKKAALQLRIPAMRAAVERDGRDFVANPNGAVTVTEFYDYRCPHCVNAAPKVLALIRSNPDLRFVFKEMPIFGATSEHAARAALAVKKAGGDYLGVYAAMMAARPLDNATIDAIARHFGAKAADLAAFPAADAQIAGTEALFKRLDLGGTPAFIVGDDIINGEDMEALAAAIAKARRGVGKAA